MEKLQSEEACIDSCNECFEDCKRPTFIITASQYVEGYANKLYLQPIET